MRRVIHVDMDAFYASVEQRDDPSLRGRPVMVGGRTARGVVAAASYEARQFGVRSAMPAARARRLCPHGVFLAARFERYREVSSRIFAIFHSVTDRVEGLSLDEAFLDVSDVAADSAEMMLIGRRLKQEIAQETGLTASVGMASNKLLAKLASDDDKPDGFVLVEPERVQAFLDPLPVRRLPGIGQRGEERLNAAGVLTVGQLRSTAPDLLLQLFGAQGLVLAERARGRDERPVKADRTRRSISQESTFREDVHDLKALRNLIEEQSTRVAERLTARSLKARTVTLKLRSGGFSTITRSRSFSDHTDSADLIAATAWQMLRDWSDWRKAFSVRLIGVGVSGLESSPGTSKAGED
ncbi:MAG: DNA polymerase IV [Wenzhouxiangella sp.]|jgi:DNA polymerase-4|nr:DNA polymerase IV [Wenzhouxiangella sp.]